MKTVGKRKPARGIEAGGLLQNLAIALRGAKPFVPRGVYRFKSHEEAQEWMQKMVTRRKKRDRRP